MKQNYFARVYQKSKFDISLSGTKFGRRSQTFFLHCKDLVRLFKLQKKPQYLVYYYCIPNNIAMTSDHYIFATDNPYILLYPKIISYFYMFLSYKWHGNWRKSIYIIKQHSFKIKSNTVFYWWIWFFHIKINKNQLLLSQKLFHCW